MFRDATAVEDTLVPVRKGESDASRFIPSEGTTLLPSASQRQVGAVVSGSSSGGHGIAAETPCGTMQSALLSSPHGSGQGPADADVPTGRMDNPSGRKMRKASSSSAHRADPMRSSTPRQDGRRSFVANGSDYMSVADVTGPDFVARLCFSSRETFGSLKLKLAPFSARPVEKISFPLDGEPQPDSALLSGVVANGNRVKLVAWRADQLPTAMPRVPLKTTKVKVNGHWWKVKFGCPPVETFGSLKERLAPLAGRRSKELAVHLGERGTPLDSALLSTVLEDQDEVKIAPVSTHLSANLRAAATEVTEAAAEVTEVAEVAGVAGVAPPRNPGPLSYSVENTTIANPTGNDVSHPLGCWGAELLGSVAGCTPGFWPDSGHIQSKFCPRCRDTVFAVPLQNACTVPPGEDSKARFTNRTNNRSFWYRRCRLVNHTYRCIGPPLILYERSVPDDVAGAAAPLPESWIHHDATGDYVWLALSATRATLKLLSAGERSRVSLSRVVIVSRAADIGALC